MLLPERPNRPELLIGKQAVCVVRYLWAQNPRTEKGDLIRYSYQPGLPAQKPFLISISRGGLDSLECLIEFNLRPDCDIGLFSRIVLEDGSLAHIPMIDFELKVCPENLEKIKRRLGKISYSGERVAWAILDSGSSYQAYCLDKVCKVDKTDAETIFLWAERCRENLDYDDGKRDEVIHSWYFIHSAVRGGMVLRLTRNREELKKKIPEVVAVL